MRSTLRQVQEEDLTTKSRATISSCLQGCGLMHQAPEVRSGPTAKSGARASTSLGIWSYNLILSESDRIESKSRFSPRPCGALMHLETSKCTASFDFLMSGGERSKLRRVQEEVFTTKSRATISSCLEGCELMHQAPEVGSGPTAKSRPFTATCSVGAVCSLQS